MALEKHRESLTVKKDIKIMTVGTDIIYISLVEDLDWQDTPRIIN